MSEAIPFNMPFTTGDELKYIEEAFSGGHLTGDGPFTRRASEHLRTRLAVRGALLTHSCTAALEMAAILANIAPGDEIIMPSYTFVSTANAFVLRGGIPVFVDIRPDTLNLDETLVDAAITPRTRAIVPVHYAGVACEMDAIMATAKGNGLVVVEDAAQGIMATYRGRALGTIGDFGCLSFHATKNISSGEGGALLAHSESLISRAEIIREKGTNRSQFFRGQVDKYTWCDIGSSYLPSDVVAAYLLAQLEHADKITALRLGIWNRYHQALASLEARGMVRRPIVPPHCAHNAHMYYLLLPNLSSRTGLIDHLKLRDIHSAFHYVPLHSAPAGARFGRASGGLPVTDDIADRLVRLPLWTGMSNGQVERVISETIDYLEAS